MSAPIASVSSEGGAFLIADAVAVRSWRGIDDPDHYDGLCAYLDADEGQVLGKFVRGNDSFATWEPGAGTALIYQRGQSFALIHGAHSNVADPFIQGAHDVPVRTLTIRIESQVIAVLWAPENGLCVGDNDLKLTEPAPPSGTLAVDGSAMLLPAEPGLYLCIADELVLDAHSLRRLRVVPNHVKAT